MTWSPRARPRFRKLGKRPKAGLQILAAVAAILADALNSTGILKVLLILLVYFALLTYSMFFLMETGNVTAPSI